MPSLDRSPEARRGREVVERLYAALGRRDPAAVAELYAADARFHDPVFGDLEGERIAAMWTMLLESAADLRVEWRDVTALGDRAAGTWVATYTLGATGRRVRNRIDSRFRIEGGRILRHVDAFDFWPWARQALGPAGLLLGWALPLRLAVRRRARARLDAWMAAHPPV